MSQKSTDDQKPKFYIKATAEAIRRNLSRSHTKFPTWAVVNGESPEQCILVWNIRGSDFETRVTPDAPLPDGYGHSIAFLITSSTVEVQFEPDGGYIDLETALAAGTLKWAPWAQEYARTGLDGCA